MIPGLLMETNARAVVIIASRAIIQNVILQLENVKGIVPMDGLGIDVTLTVM